MDTGLKMVNLVRRCGMNWKRKMRRKNLPKKYKCCGYPMKYKESYGEYVCEECGRIRRPIGEKGGEQE